MRCPLLWTVALTNMISSGEIVFGKKLGFLEQGIDVRGIMADIRFKIQYASIVS